MSQIKTIIFDSDGVITNAEMFSVQLQKQYQINASKLLSFFNGIFKQCVIGKADLKEELAKYIKLWGWQGTVDELTDFWFKSEHKIDESVIEYIDELKKEGVRCYMATNQEKYRAQYLTNEMGFGKLFKKIFFSGYLGCKKPERKFFEIVFDEINKDGNLSKGEILFCDDDQENVDGAQKFGFVSYLYKNLDDLKLVINSH